MDKHSPGPWQIFMPDDLTVPFIRSAEGKMIAGCYGNNGREEYNARLIAAAPDLLDALQRWVAVADESMKILGVEPHPDEMHFLANARSAITKALGSPDSAGAGNAQV